MALASWALAVVFWTWGGRAGSQQGCGGADVEVDDQEDDEEQRAKRKEDLRHPSAQTRELLVGSATDNR